MRRLAQELTRYLDHALGVLVSLRPWEGARHLPLFLRERYTFLEGRLFDAPLLFMVARAPDEETPATIRKHLAAAGEKWGGPVVYVRKGVTSYNRRRLIEHGVPFIVPGGQMYLPPLGIELRERFGSEKPSGGALGPSAQAVLIHMLLRSERDVPATAGRLKPRLGYAPITLSRAFDELEAADLAESSTVNRTRELRLAAPAREIWERALPLLRSPLQRRFHVRGVVGELHGQAAGMSALALRSMLAEPDNPVVAVSRERWKSARHRGVIEVVPMRESDTVDVEVWKYPPHILSEEDCVDPLSLYLTLRADSDERVQAALESMLEAAPW